MREGVSLWNRPVALTSWADDFMSADTALAQNADTLTKTLANGTLDFF